MENGLLQVALEVSRRHQLAQDGQRRVVQPHRAGPVHDAHQVGGAGNGPDARERLERAQVPGQYAVAELAVATKPLP